MTTAFAIELTDVTKQHGTDRAAVLALHELSIRIPAGQFVSVMGPSGAGKSTLLNIIAGLDTPTSGRVTVLGRDMAALTNKARSALRLRHIGIVFQTFNLFPTFSAEENVAWPLEFLGVSAAESTRAARATLTRVGIDVAGQNRRPGALSQGEQQRVAIARALVTNPSLLLADEPTGNLDTHNGTAILDLLRELNCDRSLTIVLVTHSTFAAMYGDRTIEVRDGAIRTDVCVQESSDGRVVSLRD